MIYFIAAFLRFLNLGTAQLWYDEAFTYLVTKQDLPTMMSAIMGDVHPPLYYLLMAPIAHLGLNEFFLRLPSVLLSLLAIWLTGQLASQLGLTRRAALIGQAIMALLPLQVYHGQEMRMYALLTALLLAWLLLVLQRRWVWAALVGTLALYTHNYALLYLPIIGLIGLSQEIHRPVILDPKRLTMDWVLGDEANLKGWLLSVGLPTLLWLPWQIVLLSQMHFVSASYWLPPITPGGVVFVIVQLFWMVYPPAGFASVLAVLVTLSLLGWSVIRSHRLAAWRVLILMGFGPLALAILFSLVWQPILLYRGLIASVPMWCLLIAAAMDSLPRLKLAYVVAMGLPLLVGGLVNYYTQMPIDKGLVLQDIATLTAKWEPGDLLLHSNASTYLPWAAYRPDLPQMVLPTCGANGGEISENTRKAINAYTADSPATRIWFIWDTGPTTPECETTRAEKLTNGVVPVVTLTDTPYVFRGLYLIEATQ